MTFLVIKKMHLAMVFGILLLAKRTMGFCEMFVSYKVSGLFHSQSIFKEKKYVSNSIPVTYSIDLYRIYCLKVIATVIR